MQRKGTTNHVCVICIVSDINSYTYPFQLPVISIDSWAPIINWETGAKIGELKCLLAVGSEEQITNLKDTRGLSVTLNSEAVEEVLLEKELLQNLQPLQIATVPKNSLGTPLTSAQSSPIAKSVATAGSAAATASRMKKTSDLLDMLQKVLMTPPPPPPTTTGTGTSAATTSSQAGKLNNPSSASSEIRTHSPSTCTTALKPLKPSNLKLFKFALEIQKAIGLPLNPSSKSKKGSKQRNSSKRFPPNEAPNTYVTFQAEGPYPTYKSHEGMVFATSIVEKSVQPQWQQRYRLSATIDYLNNVSRS